MPFAVASAFRIEAIEPRRGHDHHLAVVVRLGDVEQRQVVARDVLRLADHVMRRGDDQVELGVIGYLQIPSGDLRKAIRRLGKHVVSGGHLFGVWHARANLKGGFGGPRDPRVLPSVGFLKRALWGQGFDLIECTLRDGQIQTKEGLKPSITVVLLARKR